MKKSVGRWVAGFSRLGGQSMGWFDGEVGCTGGSLAWWDWREVVKWVGNGMGYGCGYHMRWVWVTIALPISFKLAWEHNFWAKAEGDTANFVKFIEISHISLIYGPIWTFLDSFWRVNPWGCGYGYLTGRVRVAGAIPAGIPVPLPKYRWVYRMSGQ